jgi:lipopolysaccharide/colanic/teichoic acid biosynthesis glycosyltransferase
VRDVAKKVRMDLLYIRRMCWLVDFRILLGTVGKFFRG